MGKQCRYINYFFNNKIIGKKMTREEFGQLIAETRKKRNMTVRDLSDLTGLDKAHITRIETGKYSVGFDVLSRICEALNVKIELKDVT